MGWVDQASQVSWRGCSGMMTSGRTKDRNNPRSVQRLVRATLIGTRSADFIKAGDRSIASTGRTYGSNRPKSSACHKALARGDHLHMDTTPYHLEGKESQALIRRNRQTNLQEPQRRRPILAKTIT